MGKVAGTKNRDNLKLPFHLKAGSLILNQIIVVRIHEGQRWN